MRWIYDFGFFIFALFSLPRFFRRTEQAGDPRELWRERFGKISGEKLRKLGEKRPVWIHAVSVGEVLAVEKFLEGLLRERPGQPVVLTTVTPTGRETARRWESERVTVLYFPFDFSSAVKRFFDSLKPECLLLVETEIWPNVIEEAKKRRVPVGIINGRISPRTFRAFRRFSLIFTPLLAALDFFLVQSDRDREHLAALGVDADKVTVTGNMKLDLLDLEVPKEEEREALRKKLGFQTEELVLIGGSTHPGEEEILLRSLRLLRAEGVRLKLILAPRHVERSKELLELAAAEGFRAVRSSEEERNFDVLVLDQLGKLRTLYGAAEVAVMGGSFVRHGGQNPVEPAAARRPILHGPWVFNFEELYRRLDEAGASLGVSGEEQLVFVLKRILSSESERRDLGRRAFEVLEKLRGATERNLKGVRPFLASEEGVTTHVS